MGWVWNVLLSFSNEEFWEADEDEARDICEPLERINQWLAHGKLVSLTAPTYNDDVGCGMDANLYGGGFKHFDVEAFMDVVKAQDWKDRARVQLWVKGAEEGMGEDSFTLIDLGRRRRTPQGKAVARSKPKAKPKGTGRRS